MLLASLGGAAGQAQPSAAQAPAAQAPLALDAVGPQPGTVVPAFSAVDQTGTERTLASLMGRRGLMLVFSRSADW